MANQIPSNKQTFIIHMYKQSNVNPFDRWVFKTVNDKIMIDKLDELNPPNSVFFYITNSGTPYVLQFESVAQPNKFIAVSGQNVVLKDKNQAQQDNSHHFVLEPAIPTNGDYVKFKVESSPASSPLYLYHDSNGYITTSSGSDNRMWFKQVPLDMPIVAKNATTISTRIAQTWLNFDEVALRQE